MHVLCNILEHMYAMKIQNAIDSTNPLLELTSVEKINHKIHTVFHLDVTVNRFVLFFASRYFIFRLYSQVQLDAK